MSVLTIFTMSGFLFVQKIKKSFCLLFMKSLTTIIVKVLPVTLIRELVPAFLKSPVTPKLVSKAVCDNEKIFHSRP